MRPWLVPVAALHGSAYGAIETAYFVAMSVQPDATRKGLLSTLISGLVSDGVWAKLDWLSVMAAHDAQAARINAVSPGQVATETVAPTFTADRGYSGDGTTQYLNTGWNPSTAGGKFVQNDCSLFVWSGTDVSSATAHEVGNSSARIDSRSGTAGLFTAQSGSSSSVTLPVATSVGLTGWSRTGASAGATYKNGAMIGAIATASTALRNASFLVCASNSSSSGGVTAGSFSTRRVQAIGWGSQLSDADHANLYTRLSTYMTAVGA